MEAVIVRLMVTLINLRNKAQICHWRTPSDAVHRATDDLIHEIDEKADELAEIYQGLAGHRLDFTKLPSASQKMFHYRNISETQLFRQIVLAEKQLARLNCYQKRPLLAGLLNVRDELLGIFQRARYRMSFDQIVWSPARVVTPPTK